jgi:hypothetical protein
MIDEQYAKSKNRQKLSLRARIIYAVVFLAAAGVFTVLWAAENGYIELRMLLGVCGFKQRFNLPCPGCGWTHAAQAFVTGRFVEAFMTQPAAALFCLLGAVTAFFSLLFGVFGVDFGLPKRIFTPAGTKLLLIAAAVVVAVGWIFTLAGTILENN